MIKRLLFIPKALVVCTPKSRRRSQTRVRNRYKKIGLPAKWGFCSKCLRNFNEFPFARARLLLQVLAFSVLSGASFLQIAHRSQGSLLSILVLVKKNSVLASSLIKVRAKHFPLVGTLILAHSLCCY